MAKFRYKYAVMGAGKSQELSRVHYNYKAKNEEVLVITPTIDDRTQVGVVSARSGEIVKSIAINPGNMKDWINENIHNYHNLACVLLDEVQFFTREDIFALKEIVVINHNVPVIAYGLKNDFKNNIFEGSQACLVVAEEIIEIMTVCSFCNKKAIMNMRFQDGSPVREGEQIVIGDEEYRQVCHKHYLQNDLKI